MEPHIERMHIQQEQIQLLPSLIGAVTVKEQSSETLPTTTYQCVDRLLADMEHLEDRIEALNEIMDAQRQRVSCLSRFTLYFHYEMNHINACYYSLVIIILVVYGVDFIFVLFCSSFVSTLNRFMIPI